MPDRLQVAAAYYDLKYCTFLIYNVISTCLPACYKYLPHTEADPNVVSETDGVCGNKKVLGPL